MSVALKKNLGTVFQLKRFEVGLRPLTLADGDAVKKWLSDPYIIQLTFVVAAPGNTPSIPFSTAASDNYLNMLIADQSRITFAVEVNGLHVGNVGLKEYSAEKDYSEFFIEIGEAEYRGKGVGKAAMAILMDYAFNVLDLSEVRLEVLEFNAVAIHVYEQLGFIKTHRTGWHYDSRGQYWQVWGMTLSKEQWNLAKNHLLLPASLVAKQIVT